MFRDETCSRSSRTQHDETRRFHAQGAQVSLGLRDFTIRNVSVAPASTVPRHAPPPRASALGELLLERELITKDQLAAAISHQRLSGRRLGQVLIDLGCTTPDAVLGAL